MGDERGLFARLPSGFIGTFSPSLKLLRRDGGQAGGLWSGKKLPPDVAVTQVSWCRHRPSPHEPPMPLPSRLPRAIASFAVRQPPNYKSIDSVAPGYTQPLGDWRQLPERRRIGFSCAWRIEHPESRRPLELAQPDVPITYEVRVILQPDRHVAVRQIARCTDVRGASLEHGIVLHQDAVQQHRHTRGRRQ